MRSCTRCEEFFCFVKTPTVEPPGRNVFCSKSLLLSNWVKNTKSFTKQDFFCFVKNTFFQFHISKSMHHGNVLFSCLCSWHLMEGHFSAICLLCFTLRCGLLPQHVHSRPVAHKDLAVRDGRSRRTPVPPEVIVLPGPQMLTSRRVECHDAVA